MADTTVAIFAVPLALLGNIVISLGYVLQKKISESLPLIEKTSIIPNLKNFLTKPLWILGVILTILAVPVTALAYSWGSISLISSLGGTSIIFIAIFSRFFLKEKINIKEGVALITIAIGVVIAGYFSLETSTQSDFNEFWNLFVSTPSVIILIVSIALCSSLLISFILWIKQYVSVAYSVVAGTTIGVAVIILNGASVIIRSQEYSIFSDWRMWILIVIFMFLSGVSTIFNQLSYQKSKAVIVIPTYNSVLRILPILYGVVVLGEWETIDTLSEILISLGIFLIIIGTATPIVVPATTL
ncbi:hypothetical protein ES708_26052 [subsurface metagenome]